MIPPNSCARNEEDGYDPADPARAWPYGTTLYGISHVADLRRGRRFDLALAPAVLRNASLAGFDTRVVHKKWDAGFRRSERG